jgi:hypothetical protein
MSQHCVLQLKDGNSQYTVEIIIIPIWECLEIQ